MQEHVGKYVQRSFYSVFCRLDVKPCGFFTGKGIELPTHPINNRGNIKCRWPLLSTLKGHVFEEMGDTAILLCLIPTPRTHHHKHSSAFQGRHGNGQNPKAIWEKCSFILH